jgi:hypothetical protein
MEQHTQQPRVHIVETTTTTTAPIDGTMAMKATTREHVAPGRSVSAPHHSDAGGSGGADAALAPSAAPPSFGSRSLRNETSPSGARAASSTALLSATHKRVSPAPNQLAASLPTYSAAAGQRSADLESSGVVPEERVAKLRAKWGIPSTDALVRGTTHVPWAIITTLTDGTHTFYARVASCVVLCVVSCACVWWQPT